MATVAGLAAGSAGALVGTMAKAAVRVAMWSGPRNISTAMMRSWGNRPDTFVCDEPLYAHYLLKTGREHPGAAEVIAAGQTDAAHAMLADTIPRLKKRMDDIPEAAARERYVTNVPTNARLLALAKEWLGAAAVAPSRLGL